MANTNLTNQRKYSLKRMYDLEAAKKAGYTPIHYEIRLVSSAESVQMK